MKPISPKIRQQLAQEAFKCAREREGTCRRRLTVEHAFGRIKQPRWSLIILCWYHHLEEGLNKEMNRHLAYQQATDKEIKETFPKTFAQHLQAKSYLAKKYAK